MVKPTDQAIIQGILTGDAASLKLVIQWVRGVVRCQSWKNLLEEDDIVQETLAGLIVNLRERRYRNEGLKAYIEGICKNKCLDGLREWRKKRVMDGSPETEIVDSSPTPEEQLAAEQRLGPLRQAMTELKPSCRQLITWMYLDDMKGEDIASELGISHGAVRQQLFKCRKRLAALVRKHQGRG